MGQGEGLRELSKHFEWIAKASAVSQYAEKAGHSGRYPHLSYQGDWGRRSTWTQGQPRQHSKFVSRGRKVQKKEDRTDEALGSVSSNAKLLFKKEKSKNMGLGSVIYYCKRKLPGPGVVAQWWDTYHTQGLYSVPRAKIENVLKGGWNKLTRGGRNGDKESVSAKQKKTASSRSDGSHFKPQPQRRWSWVQSQPELHESLTDELYFTNFFFKLFYQGKLSENAKIECSLGTYTENTLEKRSVFTVCDKFLKLSSQENLSIIILAKHGGACMLSQHWRGRPRVLIKSSSAMWNNNFKK